MSRRWFLRQPLHPFSTLCGSVANEAPPLELGSRGTSFFQYPLRVMNQ
jgi:hypothetical protein